MHSEPADVQSVWRDYRRDSGKVVRHIMMRQLIRKGLHHCRRAVMRKKVVRRKMRLHWPVRVRMTHAMASAENDAMYGQKEGVSLLGRRGEAVGCVKRHRVKGGHQLCQWRHVLCGTLSHCPLQHRSSTEQDPCKRTCAHELLSSYPGA